MCVCWVLSLISNFNRVYQLCLAITAVVLHHLISHIAVSTTGSALMVLVCDLSEAAPLYITAHFLKWQPGGSERREQTYHASRGDTSLVSQPLQPTRALMTKPQPVNSRVCLCVCRRFHLCVCLQLWFGGALLLPVRANCLWVASYQTFALAAGGCRSWHWAAADYEVFSVLWGLPQKHSYLQTTDSWRGVTIPLLFYMDMMGFWS